MRLSAEVVFVMVAGTTLLEVILVHVVEVTVLVAALELPGMTDVITDMTSVQ